MKLLCRVGIHSRVQLPRERVEHFAYYCCRRNCGARWRWAARTGLIRELDEGDPRRSS